MKKENIFDLFAEQQKDEPAQAAERIPGEVKPEDVEPTQEAAPAPEPKQETPEPQQEPVQEAQEGGKDNGV